MTWPAKRYDRRRSQSGAQGARPHASRVTGVAARGARQVHVRQRHCRRRPSTLEPRIAPGHVARPNCGTAVNDGRGGEESRASSSFRCISDRCALAPAACCFRFRCISGAVSRWLQPHAVQVPLHPGIGVELAPAEHLDRGLSAWSPGRARARPAGSDDGGCRSRAGAPRRKQQVLRRRPRSARAHFCLPEAWHLG
jgi:hypothetical protein